MAIRNFTSLEGYALGRMLAKWGDDAEPIARLKFPELPPRCNSCALRSGKHLASGSPATQMDALKCVMEGVEFRCHQPDRCGAPCSGWAMLLLANDTMEYRKMAWEFSDETTAPQEIPDE